ncbi:MAG: ATP synthase F0 subunit A [Candidatus Dadabacteria bacterium CSP1-2]|nr:MAG: ATP synthase F0 subunit A [Candidatus Dadabacteria bacterium CSP1-2]OGE22594.1 MAG: ATP synthase F0 subunit A [Candidatus Dadabacteria bacterium RBG_19FT_COMBO_40_33]
MEHFSWFTLFGLGKYDPILGAILVVLFLIFAGYKIKKNLSKENSILPEEKFTLRTIFEILTIDFLLDLITSMMGSREKAKRYFPLLGTSFMFILISNLLGLIPGFLSPTGNFNTTVACALVIFVMYNFYGFKENGVAYLKHFAGPIIYIAPLMIVIEIISHLVRPLSLSLRLFWNMTGDHLVLGIFTNLTHFVVPALFIALGIFISFLQAFIFTVLSAIYISLSTAHEH